MKLNYFKETKFLPAIKALLKELHVPVNYISNEPTTAQEILSPITYKDNETFRLISDVYFVGMVDDAAFEGNPSFDHTKINSDYDGILFFGVELANRENNLLPNRTQLADIARAFNREFHFTPVVVVFKYADNKEQYIAFANVERTKYKQEWREGEKAGKVSLLRDISIERPHRGHEDIIKELRISTSGKKAIRSYDELYQYWQEVFSVSILSKKFYKELQSWYFWAMQEVQFPNAPNILDESINGDQAKFDEAIKEHKGKNIIRLLTRVLFIWFIKEKGLIPEEIFNEKEIADNILNDFTPQKPHGIFATGKQNSKYYRAILQNLFFATLNREMGKREFRKDKIHRNVTTLMRYQSYFKNPELFIGLMESVVPYMNGGLFECLDKPHPTLKGKQGGDKIVYIDGFSDREDNTLVVPDYLFFDVDEEVDISNEIGIKTKAYKKTNTRGLLEILKAYKFTIAENTPIEEDVALDPELLGKVFENLLASYNPETKSTARKQTGSFYTPREIVNYMVDESLIAYLKNNLTDVEINDKQFDEYLHQLFSFDAANPFADKPLLQKQIIKALDTTKILDPACGSGAFPMGILQKMVHVLHKIDPNNKEWKQRQINRVDQAIKSLEEIEDVTFREQSINELEKQKEDIEDAFSNNELDYGRKLFLIENCIYGIDIQSIATQISKLRFFISLVVDQKIDKQKKNFGVRPLPNLETKFVAANTLIGIKKSMNGDALSLFDNIEVQKLEKRLKKVRQKLFSLKSPKRKRELREEDKELRDQIADLLEAEGMDNGSARQLSSWDPYDQNDSSPFFDPAWMFDVKNGFDIVIGNPPYINANDLKKRLGKEKYDNLKSHYSTSKGTIDIYILFYEFGLKSLNDSGLLTYITPNRYLSASYGEALRNFIYNNYSIECISDFSSVRVFEAASTYPIVTLLSNGVIQSDIKIRKFNADFNIIEEWKNDVDDLNLLPGKIWGFLLNSKIDIVKRFINNSLPLSQCGKVNATSTAKEAEEYHKLINSSKGLRLINTGTIDPFVTKWGKKELIDKGTKFLEPLLNIETDVVSENRKSLYLSPKIIIAKIGLQGEAFFDEKGEYASINTNCIHSFSKQFHPKYITLWLNSKLYQFLFSCFFDGLRMSGGYLLYSAPNLKSTYIKQIDENDTRLSIVLHDIHTWSLSKASNSIFESIIDGFIFSIYFKVEMTENSIYLNDFLLNDINKELGNKEFSDLSNEEKQIIVGKLQDSWTHPDNPVRNRIKLFAVRSSDILKPILES